MTKSSRAARANRFFQRHERSASSARSAQLAAARRSYVLDELGCPRRESLEEASSWGAALAAQAKEPALQVMGRVVTALAESSLGQTPAALSELNSAAEIVAARPANLVSGLALGPHHITRLKQRLALSPLLPVCQDVWSSPF